MKSLGGIAPFGYRWWNGRLVIDENEAPVRKLIYELFLKHRRKKTVAKLLNDLGYRTRSASLFSDTTIDRLLRDMTAKGIRIVDGKEIAVEPIISLEVWARVNEILGGPPPPKQALELFSGITYCSCGCKMVVPSNTPKYVCIDCRIKILKEDLEAIFHSQLKEMLSSETEGLYEGWNLLTRKEKRIICEQVCERIEINRNTITICFRTGYVGSTLEAITNQEDKNTESDKSERDIQNENLTLNEALLSEKEAAKFLGVSNTTILRKRMAGQIGCFRVGHRILYSKEKHLVPFLIKHETEV